ncbi:PorP/SprF family type IX secretion system membrane protein [Nafulsella turpanensis]|uniref:PorP/SprF family type IX secretion system membrane protein n=1 Tax=Nafulsella turpanensis TaxID=1265690 RepID=UPI00058DF18A|nr:type IX secretion system membrane protein PorP/SprF [Nafulsella turpanensis]
MKKSLIVVTAFFMLCLSVQAQQRPVFSQYMFNMLALNPAYAGNQKQLSITALARNQWVNLEGAPQTQTITSHSNFRKKNIGLGMMLYNESIGVHSDIGAYFSYAYQIKFKKSMLSLGLQGGLNQLVSDYTKLNSRSFGAADPSLKRYKSLNPNFGTGIFYSTRTAYAGFSVPYLINNKVMQATESKVVESSEKRYYFLTGGKVFDVTANVKLKPSFLIRLQERAPLSFDASLNFFIDEVLNVGVSFRNQDAVAGMFQLDLNENFSFGYAYDYTLSGLGEHARGSHEMMINYRIRLTSFPCHSYF